MPSPDLRPLVNLTLFDEDPTTLYAKALANANTLFPGWIPRTGNQEVALLQAEAVIAAEIMYGINRLPGAVIEVLVQFMGVTRSPGMNPGASATFNLSDMLGHTVPQNTRVRLALSEGRSLDFTTNQDLVIGIGSVAGTVGITAALPTTLANGMPIGTGLRVISGAGPWVDSVVLARPVSGGVDPEDSVSWQTRAMQQFQRLSSVLVNAVQFVPAALAFDPSIYRAKAIDNWDPTLNSGAGGTSEGHVTVAVYGQGNAAVPSGVKTALLAALQAQASVNLAVHVIDATVTVVNITASVQRTTSSTAATVHDAVTAALQAYLSTDNWPWEGTLRFYELIRVIEDVDGVDYLISLTAPAADVVLSGAASLVQAGTITVNVTPNP